MIPITVVRSLYQYSKPRASGDDPYYAQQMLYCYA